MKLKELLETKLKNVTSANGLHIIDMKNNELEWTTYNTVENRISELKKWLDWEVVKYYTFIKDNDYTFKRIFIIIKNTERFELIENEIN